MLVLGATMQVFEKHPTTVKNFGVWLRYQSRTGYHNMYKEFRDVTLNGAIGQLYQVEKSAVDVLTMRGSHSVQSSGSAVLCCAWL